MASGAGLDTVLDVLSIGKPALAHPACEPRDRLLVAMQVVEGEEAGHLRALDQDMALDARAQRRRVPARDGGRAADHDARANREMVQHRVADAAGGVVEIDVHAVRGRPRPARRRSSCRLVVDRRVVAERLAAEARPWSLRRRCRPCGSRRSWRSGRPRSQPRRQPSRRRRCRPDAACRLEQAEIGRDAVEARECRARATAAGRAR